MRPRPCARCAHDIPHPFRHWHIWCRFCRRPKIYRGPSCRGCHQEVLELARDILKGI